MSIYIFFLFLEQTTDVKSDLKEAYQPRIIVIMPFSLWLCQIYNLCKVQLITFLTGLVCLQLLVPVQREMPQEMHQVLATD